MNPMDDVLDDIQKELGRLSRMLSEKREEMERDGVEETAAKYGELALEETNRVADEVSASLADASVKLRESCASRGESEKKLIEDLDRHADEISRGLSEGVSTGARGAAGILKEISGRIDELARRMDGGAGSGRNGEGGEDEYGDPEEMWA